MCCCHLHALAYNARVLKSLTFAESGRRTWADMPQKHTIQIARIARAHAHGFLWAYDTVAPHCRDGHMHCCSGSAAATAYWDRRGTRRQGASIILKRPRPRSHRRGSARARGCVLLHGTCGPAARLSSSWAQVPARTLRPLALTHHLSAAARLLWPGAPALPAPQSACLARARQLHHPYLAKSRPSSPATLAPRRAAVWLSRRPGAPRPPRAPSLPPPPAAPRAHRSSAGMPGRAERRQGICSGGVGGARCGAHHGLRRRVVQVRRRELLELRVARERGCAVRRLQLGRVGRTCRRRRRRGGRACRRRCGAGRHGGGRRCARRCWRGARRCVVLHGALGGCQLRGHARRSAVLPMTMALRRGAVGAAPPCSAASSSGFHPDRQARPRAPVHAGVLA